jgi:hypothetical protein
VPAYLISVEEALPGRGRNLAIQQARHDWLACIDAGIVPNRDWLQRLLEIAAANPQAGVIYGACQPATPTFFTECAAIVYAPRPGLLVPFIASTLLHRSAWEAAGGFREDLRSGEDLLFFKALEKAGVTRAYCPDAMVTWELASTWKAIFRRFSVYSRHAMKAGLGGEWQSAVTRFYTVCCCLLLLGLTWSPWVCVLPLLLLFVRAEKRIYLWHHQAPAAVRWREMLNPLRVLLVWSINTWIDLAMFYGMLCWWWQDYLKRNSASLSESGSKSGHSLR